MLSTRALTGAAIPSWPRDEHSRNRAAWRMMIIDVPFRRSSEYSSEDIPGNLVDLYRRRHEASLHAADFNWYWLWRYTASRIRGEEVVKGNMASKMREATLLSQFASISSFYTVPLHSTQTHSRTENTDQPFECEQNNSKRPHSP